MGFLVPWGRPNIFPASRGGILGLPEGVPSGLCLRLRRGALGNSIPVLGDTKLGAHSQCQAKAPTRHAHESLSHLARFPSPM